jgi:hypothetical protein
VAAGRVRDDGEKHLTDKTPGCEALGERGHDRALERRDMSRRRKAVTCHRSPNRGRGGGAAFRPDGPENLAGKNTCGDGEICKT